jgi:hypothetical protein
MMLTAALLLWQNIERHNHEVEESRRNSASNFEQDDDDGEEEGGRTRKKRRKAREKGGVRVGNRPRDFDEMKNLVLKRWFGFEGEEAIETEEKFYTQFRISYSQYEELQENLLILDSNRAASRGAQHWVEKENKNKTVTLATVVKIIFCLDTLVSGTSPTSR